MMNWQLFWDMLSVDSTSGKEREMALWLQENLEAPAKEMMEVGDGTLNLLLSWGTPRVVFCTHMDTVPPYIAPKFPEGIYLSKTSLCDPSHPNGWAPPTFEGGAAPLLSPCGSQPSMSLEQVQGHGLRRRSAERSESCEGNSLRNGDKCLSESVFCHSERNEESPVISGRGACDAKGQLFAMYTACKKLEAAGCTDFGLLLLAGEETGSWGAKAFAKTDFRAPFLIVGEPTENKMVSASKGTKSYDLTFRGKAFHSGYPQYGESAIDHFNEFYNKLKAKDFGVDPELGETTWNVGLLHSDNPQNILSPELTCRLYFRTTFVSDQDVQDWMGSCHSERSEESPTLIVKPRGGDCPARYVTLPGFESAPVAFGSDAPHLSNFGHKIICGPGTIRVAHRPDEHILVQDLETAVEQYIRMYHALVSVL